MARFRARGIATNWIRKAILTRERRIATMAFLCPTISVKTQVLIQAVG